MVIVTGSSLSYLPAKHLNMLQYAVTNSRSPSPFDLPPNFFANRRICLTFAHSSHDAEKVQIEVHGERFLKALSEFSVRGFGNCAVRPTGRDWGILGIVRNSTLLF